MRELSALLVGLIFGVGLAVSGMTDTAKVIGFLDVFGQWDADLLFVMGAAVLTSAFGYYFVFARKKPLFENKFYLPVSQVITPRLVLGAIFFGIGWGLYGYCPGPAIASLAYSSPVSISFVGCMLMGMGIAHLLFPAE